MSAVGGVCVRRNRFLGVGTVRVYGCETRGGKILGSGVKICGWGRAREGDARILGAEDLFGLNTARSGWRAEGVPGHGRTV